MNVSVVVPTYNRAHQIADTLRSVVAQSHTPHEIIVVDDGSTDETEVVCAAFRPAVRYVRQSNAGVSAARNHGASLATGGALAFVDSDDLWHPAKIQTQVAALAQTGAGWSITGCDVIDMLGTVIPSRRGFKAVFGVFDSAGLEPGEFFRRYFREVPVSVEGVAHTAFTGDAFLPLFLGNFALPSSALVRRELFEQSGGFDVEFRLAEETEFFHRLAALAPAVILTEPLVGYRTGQSGSLISPANAEALIRNAIRSGRQAAALRAETAEVARHAMLGERALWGKLAYVQLSVGQAAAARTSLREAWRAGEPRMGRSLMVYVASLLPPRLLGLGAAAKRLLRH